MEKAYFVGLDIAKNVFQVFLADQKGNKISNRKISREHMEIFFARLDACTIGLEACGCAHYWARTLAGYGHTVKMIQPIRVKAFLCNNNKTDAADAKAICEALMHPETRFVAAKAEAQQDMDHVLGMRERLVGYRTQLINQIRSDMAERGIVMPQGRKKFENEMPQILSMQWDKFSNIFQIVITESMDELRKVNDKIDRLDEMIKKWCVEDNVIKNLMSIPGVGPLCSAAIVAHVGNAGRFKNGRQMSAYFGLTPKEHSSGGKQKLLGITKRGNKRVRTLLIIAGRAVMTGLSRRKKGEDGLPAKLSNFEKWVLCLQKRIGVFKAAVAVANKLGRLAWAIMTKNEVFNPIKASLCPAKV